MVCNVEVYYNYYNNFTIVFILLSLITTLINDYNTTITVGVCSMWSSREQHAVTTYGSFIYLSGGYASRLYSDFSNCGPYACGDTDASAYRYFMSDVWRSKDGMQWDPVTELAFR